MILRVYESLIDLPRSTVPVNLVPSSVFDRSLEADSADRLSLIFNLRIVEVLGRYLGLGVTGGAAVTTPRARTQLTGW